MTTEQKTIAVVLTAGLALALALRLRKENSASREKPAPAATIVASEPSSPMNSAIAGPTAAREKPAAEACDSAPLTVAGQLDRMACELRHWSAPRDATSYVPAAQLAKLVGATGGPDGATAFYFFSEHCAMTEAPSGRMLRKNPGRYVGQSICITNARIIEIHEEAGVTTARIDYSDDEPVFVAGRFESPFVQGQHIDLAGYWAGEFSYESRAGWKISLPSIAAGVFMRSGTYDRAIGEIRRVQRREQRGK